MKAGSIEEATARTVDVDAEIPGLLSQFGRAFDRDMDKLDVENEGEIGEAILALEQMAVLAGDCSPAPRSRASENYIPDGLVRDTPSLALY